MSVKNRLAITIALRLCEDRCQLRTRCPKHLRNAQLLTGATVLDQRRLLVILLRVQMSSSAGLVVTETSKPSEP